MKIFDSSQIWPATLTLVGTLMVSPAVLAEEEHDENHHAYHKNTVGVFAGITGEDRRERGFTLAIEYERRLNEKFGVGVILERAFGDLDFDIYALTAAYHAGHWKYIIGVGKEDAKDHHGTENLVRVGLERAFEVGSFEIAPQFSVDYVDGETVFVVGAVFAKGF